MQDFMAIAFERSVRALDQVDIRLKGSELQISFKGFLGFKPSVFDGVTAILDTLTDEGIREIHGTLEVVPSATPRGNWYKYRFAPDKPHELFFILARETLLTNVSRIKLVSPHGEHALKNLFCFEPFAAAPI